MLRRPAQLLLPILLAACGGDGALARPVPPPPGGTNMAPYRGAYRLPVLGEWRVHRTHYRNRADQSSAVDLVKTGGRRAGFRRRARSNESFPSWGQPIVADGPGVVVQAVDGIPDNPPGRVNGYEAHGNYVVIDHRNGEYSLFAHFARGTVRVRAGQAVAMGQELGLCGNSGKSTEPHLHWQVMNNQLAHFAKGVPIRYAPYLNGGRSTTKRLDTGDVVQAQ